MPCTPADRPAAVEGHLGIVIVTYNSARCIAALLDSVPGALDGLHADVVVVDNGSTDATVALVEQLGGVELLRSENVGYAGGINAGVAKLGHCDAYLILNPDLVLAPGAARVMYETLRRSGAASVAPQVRSPDGTLQYSLRREPTLLRAVGFGRTGNPLLSEYHRRSAEYLTVCPVDWALGAVLMIDRAAFEVLGGWDESYFLHSEETDFLLRARDLGLVCLYEPAALVVHAGQGSGHDERVHAMQVVNRVRLYRRRHHAAAAWLYLAVTALQELSWWARGAAHSRTALQALLRPRTRPVELGCSGAVMPR